MNSITVALRHWTDNDYICDNWWYNQIGTPMAWFPCCCWSEKNSLLPRSPKPHPSSAVLIPKHRAPGPGGDRIKIAGIQAKHALFLGDDQLFRKVIGVIEGEIKQSEWVGARYGYGFRNIPTGFSNRKMGGRGIMQDYSSHHRVDGVNNTLSYGLGYAAAFAEWAVYTTGTDFSFSEENSPC